MTRAKTRLKTFLAPRASEEDDEARFRETLERKAQQFMNAVDGVISLREQDQETSRMRAIAWASMQSACREAMEAFHLSKR